MSYNLKNHFNMIEKTWFWNQIQIIWIIVYPIPFSLWMNAMLCYSIKVIQKEKRGTWLGRVQFYDVAHNSNENVYVYHSVALKQKHITNLILFHFLCMPIFLSLVWYFNVCMCPTKLLRIIGNRQINKWRQVEIMGFWPDVIFFYIFVPLKSLSTI